jgi:hypothetical protein
MPINKTILEEIEAIDFAIVEFTAQAKNNSGMSEGQIQKRESLKTAIQSFQSIKSRLKVMEARQHVEQPRLF